MPELVHEFHTASEDQTHQEIQNLRDKHAKKCFTEILECFFLINIQLILGPRDSQSRAWLCALCEPKKRQEIKFMCLYRKENG